MDHDIDKLVSSMTLEEKASLCSGLDNWFTKPADRLGIPRMLMTDGPHGLRKEKDGLDDALLRESIPSTCFPSGAALACSWDRELIYDMGKALGQEAKANGVQMVLGPAVNIKRSPLCGRNFEYYSEDPLLSTEMATGYINGVQSNGVGTSIKHFAANNKETSRMSTDTLVDERTLREIYLASFEGAIKNARPWTVMCAYNKLNGRFCSENKWLLTDLLRGEWGFEGFVVSDWGAVNLRENGIEAGLELEMPTSYGDGDARIVEAVKSGRLKESDLDTAVKRLLGIILRADSLKDPSAACDLEAHHSLAKHIAEECMVLLKNDGTLPLKKTGKLAVIGSFAKSPRYQGGGSSHINPYKVSIPLEEIGISAPGLAVSYSDGYSLPQEASLIGFGFGTEDDSPDDGLIGEAVKTAAAADVAVIFAGLPDSFESEGYDRRHIRMPESHTRLIAEVAKVQRNTVVVLMNGSPVEMPWIDDVSAVLEGYLGGQAAGGAIADLLFGDANPSGKLTETFPKRLSDNPSHLNFPGEPDKVEYREGIFVGYRYYDKKQIEPLFPFGHGLSYTSFEYTGISVSDTDIADSRELKVTVSVKNAGGRAGKEVVQLYVRDVESGVIRPDKELKGFEKVELAPGETKTVAFTLSKRAFAYYDVSAKDWVTESGEFELLAGPSSASLPLKAVVKVSSTAVRKIVFDHNSLIRDVVKTETGASRMKTLMGEDKDVSDIPEFLMDFPVRNLHMLSREYDARSVENFIKKLNAEEK